MVTLEHLIDELSPSKLEAAHQCLAKILFSYVEHAPRRYRADAQLGNAIDAAGNAVYRLKIKTKKDVKPRTAAELFEDAWEYEAGAVDDWQGETRGGLLDRGVQMITLWADRVARHVTPTATQKQLTREVPDVLAGGTFRLKGVVDMIGIASWTAPSVCDLKQSYARFPEGRMQRSCQPVVYTILAGLPRFEFHVVTRQETPQLQILKAEISDSDRSSLLLRASMIRRQIGHAFTTGDWLPNRTHQLCSRRYCEHWESCEKRFGGQVPQ